MPRYDIIINDCAHTVLVTESRPGEYRVLVDQELREESLPETPELTGSDEVSPSPGGSGAATLARASRVVTAPMPGLVQDIPIHVGDIVERGELLLVLEAMKMRNEIRAEFAGRVALVHVSPGQQVSHAEALVTLSQDQP